MKKLIVLFVVIFVGLGAYAQDQNLLGLERTCVLKFMPVNNALQSTSFEIEHMINGKSSITFGFGIPNTGSIIGKYGIEASPDNIWRAEFNTMHIRAAYRHYSGQSGLPRGFYIEPYMKYQQVQGQATVNIDDHGARFPALLTTNFNTVNAGLQMGVQFMIARKLTIDFYFLGLEGGLLNGNLSAQPYDLRYYNNMRSKIDQWISDAPSFVRDKLIVTNNLNGAFIDVNVRARNAPYPWYRGGVGIGLAF